MEIYTLITSMCDTNTYILIADGQAIVVDPGANATKISEFIAGKNATLKYILVTHAHFDHIGAVAELQAEGASVYISQTDYDHVSENDQFGDFAHVKPFNADVTVKEGDVLELIGHTFKVMETPGHTAGGVCYIMDDETIFSGDTLFRLSVGRTDLPYGNHDDIINSLKKLFALPHDYEVLPGHSRPTTLDFERKCNPYVK